VPPEFGVGDAGVHLERIAATGWNIAESECEKTHGSEQRRLGKRRLVQRGQSNCF
jgi:hypothetical protein